MLSQYGSSDSLLSSWNLRKHSLCFEIFNFFFCQNDYWTQLERNGIQTELGCITQSMERSLPSRAEKTPTLVEVSLLDWRCSAAYFDDPANPSTDGGHLPPLSTGEFEERQGRRPNRDKTSRQPTRDNAGNACQVTNLVQGWYIIFYWSHRGITVEFWLIVFWKEICN